MPAAAQEGACTRLDKLACTFLPKDGPSCLVHMAWELAIAAFKQHSPPATVATVQMPFHTKIVLYIVLAWQQNVDLADQQDSWGGQCKVAPWA